MATNTTLALQVSRTITADASGYAAVSLGPSAAHESWIIERITVHNNGIFDSRVSIYHGKMAQPTRFIEGTSAGNSDVSNTNLSLSENEAITVEWTGASTGSYCTVILAGKQILRGQRLY